MWSNSPVLEIIIFLVIEIFSTNQRGIACKSLSKLIGEVFITYTGGGR